MTKRFLMLLFFMTGSVCLKAQPAEDKDDQDIIGSSPCGCDVALRYDDFKLKKTVYSEIALGKYIDRIKNSQSNIGGGIGFKIGDFGFDFNSSQAKAAHSKYTEYMSDKRVMDMLTEYESRATSSISYETYVRCMEACLGGKSNSLYVYRVSEDVNQIVFRIAYNNEANGQVKVSYVYPGGRNTVTVKANTKRDVIVKREYNDPFDVVFTANNTSYSIKTQKVLRFAPISQIYTIGYTMKRNEKIAESISATTHNNHYRKWKESYANPPIPNIDTLKQGTYKTWKKVGKLTATNVFIVIEAGPNEKLDDISVSYEGPKGWRYPSKPENGFLVKGEKKVVYNMYCWSRQAIITINYSRISNEEKKFEIPIFTNDDRLQFDLPSTAENKIIIYDRGGEKRISFEGNPDIIKDGEPIESDELTFYSFKVSKVRKK